MITEEQTNEKLCLFCASDFHLEMILLPYIKERIETSEFVIFTQNNLEETLKELLTKINIDEMDKKRIENLNWKNDDNLKYKKLDETNRLNKEISIIINGDINYINEVDYKIKKLHGKDYNIIHCFHVGEKDLDIQKISQNYKLILNTKRV